MLNCIVCSSSVLPAKTLRSAGIFREIWAENFPGQRKLFSQSEKIFFLGREGKLSSQRVFSPNPPFLRFLPFVSIFVHIHVFPVLIVLGFHCSFCLSVFPPFAILCLSAFLLLNICIDGMCHAFGQKNLVVIVFPHDVVAMASDESVDDFHLCILMAEIVGGIGAVPVGVGFGEVDDLCLFPHQHRAHFAPCLCPLEVKAHGGCVERPGPGIVHVGACG